MGFKDILNKIGEKSRERKELLSNMQEQLRLRKLAEDRMKSSNERELEQLMNEDREEAIKEKLEYMRKKRDHDIKFNHNPLFVENITNKTNWSVLKEKNQFANNKNMFVNQPFIHKSDKNLLKNNKRMFSI